MDKMVSVIIATYKREESLKKALDSLTMQTYKNYEIVLVDDNAELKWNQTVARIVKDFQEENKDILFQFIQNEKNLGSAQSRNKGIECAKGDYITFLDDDDYYLPEKIFNQVEFMKKNLLDYSVTDLDLYYDNGKLYEKKRRRFLENSENKSLFSLHLMYHITGTDTMMFTKSYIEKIGGFAPIDVGDEFYLMQRAIEMNGKFGYLPCCDVVAYVHTTQEGLSSGLKKVEGENALYEHKRQYFKELQRKERRYIKMRHYAVLAFAYLRMKKYKSFFLSGIKSFCSAPIACCRLLLKSE